MSSFKSLTSGYKPSKIYHTAKEPKKGWDENVLRLADNLILNDLQPEYYYTLDEIVKEAIDAHTSVIDKDQDTYVHIIKQLLPIALEAQKALSAIYIFDRLPMDKAKDIFEEIIKDMTPRWKLLTMEILKKPKPELKLKHKGWGRRARKIAKVLIDEMKTFQVMKYAKHIQKLARWAHIKPDKPSLAFIFNMREQKDLMEKDGMIKDYLEWKKWQTWSREELMAHLKSTNLPYTILKGFLSSKLNDPEIFEQLIHNMTIWETILSIRQLENRGLLERNLEQIIRKLKVEKLEEMRIDIVELFQAYRAVQTQTAKELLARLIMTQMESIKKALLPLLSELKVGIAIDQSGSMSGQALEYSLALGFALAKGGAKQVKVATFSTTAYDLPIPESTVDLIKLIDMIHPLASTSIGAGMERVLTIEPDILIVVSDMEQNAPPYTDEVYQRYVTKTGKKPIVISIKFTNSPKLAVGEIEAMLRGRWLKLGEDEYCFVIRNVWDLVRIIEFVLAKIKMIKKPVAGVA
jgi:hypothetical protein